MCDEEEVQRKSVDVLQPSRPEGQAGTPSMTTPEGIVPVGPAARRLRRQEAALSHLPRELALAREVKPAPEKSPVKPPTAAKKKRRVLSKWEHESNQLKWLSDKQDREEEAAYRQWLRETGTEEGNFLHGDLLPRHEFEMSGRSPRANRVAAIKTRDDVERARIAAEAAAQPWWKRHPWIAFALLVVACAIAQQTIPFFAVFFPTWR
jgi:hypothetical protein